MEEKTSKREFKDTEDMVQWKSINQEGLDNLWKELCGTMEEEVPEKYKVYENKRGADKGRGERSELRTVQSSKKDRKWRENMFLSFSVDGWSVPRRTLGNARF